MKMGGFRTLCPNTNYMEQTKTPVVEFEQIVLWGCGLDVHVKNVLGHKTDKKDSAWLSKLLLSGVLKASFIHKQDIRELRDLVRYKKKIVSDMASEKQGNKNFRRYQHKIK